MAEAEGSFDPLRTVVVTNIPGDVNEDDLTIHFQKEKNGGGDVDYIELTEDGSKAFVTFDMTEVTTSILSYAQTINGSSLEVQSYDSWLKSNKKKQEKTPVDNTSKDTGHARAGAGHEAPAEDAVTTIFVSGIKESTTKDAITLFFENKRRSGGGELKPDKTGFKRISPTIARLTYESSQDAGNVLKKANETQLQLDGNLLTVSTVFVPTHDRSILLAKNMNPKTSEDTLKDFVEATKNVEVQNIIFGKDSKAIVILKEEIDEDPSDDENVTKEMMLEDFAISLEFAPLTKRIRIQNIPPSTSSDAIRFKFSNKKIGGSKVTDLMLDQKNGVANVYFEEFSAVSKLVKNEHQFENIPLTVIPFYDDFEVQEEVKTTEFSGEYDLDPLVMVFIMNHHQIESMFELKSMKFDDKASRIRFTKEFDDSKDAVEFEKKLKEFLQSFHKEEVRIPKIVFEEVKKTIEQRREGIEDDTIDVSFDDLRVIFVGKKDQVTREKGKVEKMIDTYSEQVKLEPHEFKIDDEKKLNFLNLIGYSEKLTTEFPEVQIHGMDSGSGKMTLFGTSENVKDVKIRIFHDLSNIAEIDLKMSDRQIDFLQRTGCQIVNDELKKDDVMLILKSVKGHVGARGLQAKIMTLKKCDDTEEKRLVDIVLTKTSEKCIKVDENTAKFLAKSNKLQEFKKEQFDQHKVFIDSELADPCNIWIVCEKSKMSQAEQELGGLIDVKKITSSTFKPREAIKVRFLKEHCWDKIKEKQHSCQAEGVVVEHDADPATLKITGTKAGRNEIITFLENLSKKVECKTYPVTEPGMKKQVSMETTATMISGIEKEHKCVIEREIPPEEPEMAAKRSEEELPEDAVTADGGLATEAGVPTMNLPYDRMSFVNDKEVKITSSGQKISIVVGDLAQQKVDVIVNTTNDKVDLKANPCGKALLKVAGKELLNECQKIGSLQAGQMASTGPAKLKCQRVYHVRSSHWENGKGAPILRQLIKNCLDQVEKDKLTSISIPAIGTGNLHFPRPEVAKIFFEEVVGFFTAHPQSAILDVRFVAYSGDQPSVDAFLAAVQKIKSMVSAPPIRVASMSSKSVRAGPIPKKRHKPTASHLTNVTTTEKLDGSLEFSLGKISVQIVYGDISKETTDLIMHVTNQEFSFQGGVGKAIIKAGGDGIVKECKALAQPGHYTTQFTKAGNLSVNEIAHVIGTGQPTYAELKQCLDNFFDELSKKNIVSVSFSSIGAGAMGFSESQSADLIFDNLSRMAESKNLIPPLKLARIVIFEKPKFVKFKDAAKAYLASGGVTSSSPQPKTSFSPKGSFNVFRKRSAKPSSAENGGISIKIYSDDRGTRDKVWKELEKKLQHNIDEKSVNDEIIKTFSDKNVEKLRQLERDFDVKITEDIGKGKVKIKGYTKDVSSVQEEVHTIINDLKEIVAKESKRKVPDYWDGSAVDGEVSKISLPTTSQEYKNVETQFRKTAPNQIVRIERIQNKGIYALYNVKRETMMNKYGSNFAGKELMLFHGTSQGNIEYINAGGLNRSYAGIHATAYGRGVYFARDASYSCSQTYSQPDPQGLRYMYYAKVLVGEYTVGNSSMLVPPPKNPSDPNDSYNSVVDNMSNPGIYVMFQDYEYYTEYLITFK